MTKYILIGSAVVISLMSLALWLLLGKVEKLNYDLGIEKSNVIKLKENIIRQNGFINKLTTRRTKDQTNIISLNKENNKFREETANLRRVFREHNLESLSQRKPELIQRIINRATKRVFKNIEKITK